MALEEWRIEMQRFTKNKKELKLLQEGPKSWMQAMRLGALKNKYEKIMGIKNDPEPKNCQSSFKEWNDSIK